MGLFSSQMYCLTGKLCRSTEYITRKLKTAHGHLMLLHGLACNVNYFIFARQQTHPHKQHAGIWPECQHGLPAGVDMGQKSGWTTCMGTKMMDKTIMYTVRTSSVLRSFPGQSVAKLDGHRTFFGPVLVVCGIFAMHVCKTVFNSQCCHLSQLLQSASVNINRFCRPRPVLAVTI